jgi:serine/threonine protein kinase
LFFSERKAAKIVKELLYLLSYLHDSCEMIHGDLKPENILFTANPDDVFSLHVKVIDFHKVRPIKAGQTHKILGDEKLPWQPIKGQILGSSFYSAPEVLED